MFILKEEAMKMKEISYRQAIYEAIDEEMTRDPMVFMLGEDIGKAWGAALGELKGLFDKYGPERIRETSSASLENSPPSYAPEREMKQIISKIS